MSEVSAMDVAHLAVIRANVTRFVATCAERYDRTGAIVLDVAPNTSEGARPHFVRATVETLDIAPASGATYVADITARNDAIIPAERFDYVVCTEVLEHTLQPFDAVAEIERVLKPGGVAIVTVPFNLRLHGPLPDCWRFTEHGLRALFQRFTIVELEQVDTEDRFLMPIQYTLLVEKPASTNA
jgi:SAM-dependent methyltransferase